MKSLLILTDVDFWKQGAGHRMRIAQLIIYLSHHTLLTVIYLGFPSTINEDSISTIYKCKFRCLENSKILTPLEYGNLLKTFTQRNCFEFCIIEYIHLSYYLQFLPKNLILILDTHDIISEREESFKEFHSDIQYLGIDWESECAIYNLYDYVIAICAADYEKLNSYIEKRKLLLCPHPVKVVNKTTNIRVSNIGFVGSEYLPNIDAIEFFSSNCWPAISKCHNVTLTIYGNVKKKIKNIEVSSSTIIKGFVHDLETIYNECDIIINPVRFGAGLKIKNLEAMAHGIPLITTPHGARGIEIAAQKAFLVASNATEFVNCLSVLIENVKLRQTLSFESKKFISEYFSHIKCYSQLNKVININ